MGDHENDGNNNQSGNLSGNTGKPRDIFSDRVIAIVCGAVIPLVLLFIPLVNKWLDNTKEIKTAQIQGDIKDLEIANGRITTLSSALIQAEIESQKLDHALTECISKKNRNNGGA